MMLASMLRPHVRCSTCKEPIKSDTEIECSFCQRERSARNAAAFNYSNGQLMEQILLNDVEVRRMYDHNKDRLGQGVSITTYLTAAVLFVTGLVGALDRVDRGDLVFMAGGLVVAGGLKMLWWYVEWTGNRVKS